MLFVSDIDECATNTSDCDGNATCKDTFGSYTCMCNKGYTGNGTSCNSTYKMIIYLFIDAKYH